MSHSPGTLLLSSGQFWARRGPQARVSTLPLSTAPAGHGSGAAEGQVPGDAPLRGHVEDGRNSQTQQRSLRSKLEQQVDGWFVL